MANRLAQETSPYLLQHSENPVDWRPWGPDALAEAGARDVPLLVSIGYSACHWCHVMERESFEDPETAAAMNTRFVCVKVDREERPDVDAVYMDAVQAMTGHGGWPLNAFLTPDGVPFFGGTYFPPAERRGMPAWTTVLDSVADAWANRREEIRAGAPRVLERLRGAAALRPAGEAAEPALLDAAVEALGRRYDRIHGGFGGAPKFPPSPTIEFLMGRGEREMSLGTLRAMARGGIHDQLGGGFARYAVDATWTVPHFEKMLYDNALLARAYLHGHLLSGDVGLRAVCESTLDWALREMRAPDGGFHAALDADTEGEEGRFYVWTLDELRAVLGDGPEARAAIEHLGATAAGNFEGARNVLLAVGDEPAGFGAARAALLAAREHRVRPGLDDKRICSWNALMVAALADAGAALERPDYLDAAVATAEFLLGPLRAGPGRLLRTYNRGQARLDGVLEDHAYTLEALLTLYEASFDERWFVAARELADGIIERFADAERGGFFSTASDAEALIVRRKELHDAPIPSGQASAALGLLRLAALTGERHYEEHAERTLRLAPRFAADHPDAFGHWLRGVDLCLGPSREVALVGDRRGVGALARTVRAALRPRVVLAGRILEADEHHDQTAPDVPVLVGRGPVEGRAAAYVCERFSCRAPVTEPAELERELAGT